MSFRHEDEDENISPNLSSEELKELTDNKSYKNYLNNSSSEYIIKKGAAFIKKDDELDNYKINSYNDVIKCKNELSELNQSYRNKESKDLSKKDNNNNISYNTKIINEEILKEKNNVDNEKQNENKSIQLIINKTNEEQKNSNIDSQEKDISHNYQSFLTERLNLINKNFDNNKNELSDFYDKKQNNLGETDFYKYNNLSEKDIMAYYFNFDDKTEMRDYKDTIKMNKEGNDKNLIIKNNNIKKANIRINQDIKTKSYDSNNNSVNNNTKKETLSELNLNYNKSSTNIKTIDIDNSLPNYQSNINFINDNNKSGFNTQKNSIYDMKKSIDNLESINLRKIDQEEEGMRILLEDEYKKLTLLEEEKLKLIEEEKIVRKKILEEVEKQEKEEKKKEKRIKYLEKIKKKEEDEKRLRDIKLKQEKELKEIIELKDKKKLEEEKLGLILEGKLKLNIQEINDYKKNLQYHNFIKIEDEMNKDNKNNNDNYQIIQKYQQNIEDSKKRTMKKYNETSIENISYEKNKNNTLNREEIDKNKKKRSQTITTSSDNKIENEDKKRNDFASFSPSLSSFSNKNYNFSIPNYKNNFETYENIKSNLDRLISLPLSQKQENIFSLKNEISLNNQITEHKSLVEKSMNDYYEKKKKKYMKRKKTDNILNYKTNIYNDKKIFQKLIDNIEYKTENYKGNKRSDLDEVNKIQEIASKAKNEIDKTINAINKLNKNINNINYNTNINNERISKTINENPYLKYGNKCLKKKKEDKKIKKYKQKLNLNSRNFNGYMSDNYEKIKYQKASKSDDLDINIKNENVDYNNENIDIDNYSKYRVNNNDNKEKHKHKYNFNGVLSDNNIKFTNYYMELYGKK